MEFYVNREMTSRQGKAINHAYPTVFAKPTRRPAVKPTEPLSYSSFSDMLKDLEAQRLKEEESKKNVPTSLTASFKAISREQYTYANRNKTFSPGVGVYNPNWTAVKPRTTQGPRLLTQNSTPRSPQIFMPSCVQNDLDCSFPQRKSIEHSEKLGNFYEDIKRTMSNINDYNEKVEEKSKNKPDPKKITYNVQSPINFNQQVSRKKFVDEKNPPNEKRFDFSGNFSHVYSKNKKVKTFAFEKSQGRKELFAIKHTLPDYDGADHRKTKSLGEPMLEFDKMVPRKELIYTHMLETPLSIPLDQYEKAYFKQSTVRGPYKIPLMSTTTPRDDLMYKTNGAYILNIAQ
jgi:hypothetical protein